MLNQILKLERPLVIFDFETTGLDAEVDRVIQLGITFHFPDKDPVSRATLIDPETPILNDQHGITDEDIRMCHKCKDPEAVHPKADCQIYAKCPTFRALAPDLARRLINVDLGGYNVNFDIKFMKAEMKRAGVPWAWDGHIVDPLQIYRFKRGHTLTNCYLEFGSEDGTPLPKDTKVEDAHDAGADVRMTETALRGQLLRFPDLPRTVKELADFCFPHPENAVDKTGKFVWLNGEAAFNFGKWRGRLLRDPSCRGYLKWMGSGDFSDEVKDICNSAVDGDFPVKE